MIWAFFIVSCFLAGVTWLRLYAGNKEENTFRKVFLWENVLYLQKIIKLVFL